MTTLSKKCLFIKRYHQDGTSLAVQWLRLCTPNTGGMGLILGQGTKIPHATWCGLKKKKRYHKGSQKTSCKLGEDICNKIIETEKRLTSRIDTVTNYHKQIRKRHTTQCKDGQRLEPAFHRRTYQHMTRCSTSLEI